MHAVGSVPIFGAHLQADLPHHLRHAAPNPTQRFKCELRELLPFDRFWHMLQEHVLVRLFNHPGLNGRSDKPFENGTAGVMFGWAAFAP